MIFSLDVAHLLQTGELAMNLGPGKGGGLGWRVHIWDDVTLGRFGYAVPLERPLESPARRHGSVRKMVPDVLV